MVIAPTREAALAVARGFLEDDPPGSTGGSGGVGLVMHEETAASEAAGIRLRVLSRAPLEYARRLYGTLHELDDAGLRVIVVQAVPADEEAWAAVADRLARGSSPQT